MIATMPAWPIPLLAAATVVSGALAILSAPWGFGQPWMNLVFKPLTTLLIIAYAWPRGADRPLTRRWVLLGLALSLCGDVALMWPERGFLPGLVSFLLAHLAYLRAFTRDGVRLAARPLPFVLYGLLAALILWQLWPGVPPGLRAAGAGLRGLPGFDGGAGGGGRAAVARHAASARRPLAGRRRRLVPVFGCAAGHQPLRRAAAAVGPVDPAQLLAGAVVHRLVAGGAGARAA